MASKTLVALYDDFADAVHAVRALEEAGFQHEDISLIANNAEHRWGNAQARRPTPQRPGAEASHAAGTGAAAGAVAGGTAALLASLGLLAIPGVGPVLAAGPVVALITGAGVGAAAGGLVGGLVGLGVAEAEAHAFAEGVRRGGALVTAQVPGDGAARAIDILEQHNPVDLEERAAGWRESGWRGFESEAEPWTVRSIEEERRRWHGGSRSTTGAGFEAATGSGPIGGGEERSEGGEPAARERAAELRAGRIHRESETARMSGGPVSTAMSGMAGSPEGLREQDEPLKRHGDMARVRSYDSGGTSPGGRVDRAIDRAAAGDKPMHADDPDRYDDDPLAGRK